MGRFIDGLIGAAAMLALVGACAILVLSLEKNAPQAPAVTGKGSTPSSSLSQPAALLSHPLPYKAVVCQSSGDEPKCRYYVPKEPQ